MKRLLHRLSAGVQTLQGKLMLVITAVIIAPLLLFGSLLFHRQVEANRERVFTESQRDMELLASRINLELSQFSTIINLYYFDLQVNKLLIGTGNDEIRHLYSKYNTGINQINFQVMLVSTGGRMYGNAAHLDSADFLALRAQPCYSRVLENSGQQVWTVSDQLDDVFTAPDNTYLYTLRHINDFKTWTPVGMVIIGFSRDQLARYYRTYAGEGESLYILDDTGNIVVSMDGLGLDAEQVIQADSWGKQSDAFTLNMDGRELFACYHTVDTNRWKVVRFADTAITQEDLWQFYTAELALLLIYFVVAVAVSYLFSHRFVRPIKALSESMVKLQQGDFTAHVTPSSNDEVGQLSNQFNTMAAQIQELMNDIYRQQNQKRKAELMSLQSQINPHFLYNTLASIRYLVYTGKTEQADETIITLIKLLRNMLSDIDEIIPVRREVQLLESYIAIQKVAGEEFFDVSMDIQGRAMECMTLKLVLQPLVENAIHHGLKPRKEGGLLRIAGHVQDEELIFEISDNGMGMDVSRISFDPETIDVGKEIGLQNVHSRIRLHFGKPYGLEVESQLGAGTLVRARLPVILEKGYMEYEHIDR